MLLDLLVLALLLVGGSYVLDLVLAMFAEDDESPR